MVIKTNPSIPNPQLLNEMQNITTINLELIESNKSSAENEVEWIRVPMPIYDHDAYMEGVITIDNEINSESVEYDFKDKRADFEHFCKRINKSYDLSRSKDGGYTNMYVELAWATFKYGVLRTRTQMQGEFNKRIKAMKEAWNIRSVKPVKVTKPYKREGPFFIGGYDNSNKKKILQLGKHPKFHKDLENAKQEAQRLANLNDGNYWIYGSTGIKYTKQPDVQVIYIVKGYLDQIHNHLSISEYTWEKDIETDPKKCNPNLACVKFENKESAISLYMKMAELDIQRFKNWY